MRVHTLDKASVINELQFGPSINRAVFEGRRADFGLLLSMFSHDVRDNVPSETLEEESTTDAQLRQRFALPHPQPLRSDSSSYEIAARHSHHFHQGGLASAKLSHYLIPDALTYLPEETHNLPEEVYHNLSGHLRRQLDEAKPRRILAGDLYNKLVTAQRQSQIHLTS